MAAEVPDTYRLIRRLLRFIVNLFFRDVEVTGLDLVPKDEEACGILVSWHPNGLIDPGLIVTHFPHQVVFGARHGLFRYPVLGRVMRAMGTVRIYRAMDLRRSDPDARRAANAKSLEALATRVAEGSFSALFPEGKSHDEPRLVELKTGAARLYYRARQRAAERGRAPVIIPVGLHYDKKHAFRSNALIAFHEVLALPESLDVTPPPDESPEDSARRCTELTAHIERTLRDVVHATDDWPLHHALHRLRRLIRAERAARADADPGRTTIGERVLGFARVRAGYYAALEQSPREVEALRARVESYDADLRALDIEDYDLDRAPSLGTRWLALLTGLQFLAVFVLLPAIVVLGWAVNLPTALALMGIARVAARQQKEEATVKLLFGAMLYPLTWIAAGVAAGFAHEAMRDVYPLIPDTAISTGIATAVVSAIGGAIALRYLRMVRETARAVRVRFTRRGSRRAISRLRRERAKLHDESIALVQGVQLPGDVMEDGRVVDGDVSPLTQADLDADLLS